MLNQLGVHATSREIAGKILAEGFHSGRRYGNYLGDGVYFYLVAGPHGLSHAMDSAKRVAEKKYGSDVAYLVVNISCENALSLQHQYIRKQLRSFALGFNKRLGDLGFWKEDNIDDLYFRPHTHLVIEAFLACLEAISSRPIDVVSSTFFRKDDVIDYKPPPEICVRTLHAISRADIQEGQSLPGEEATNFSTPEMWPCPDILLSAAEQAVDFVGSASRSEIVSLVTSVRCPDFLEKLPQQQNDAPFDHFLIGSSRLAKSYSNPNIRSVELAELQELPLPTAVAKRQQFCESAASMIVGVSQDDFMGRDFALISQQRRPELPMIMLTDDVMNIPPEMRHSRSILLFDSNKLARNHVANDVITGFLANQSWKRAIATQRLTLAIAARLGDKPVIKRDAQVIAQVLSTPSHPEQRSLFEDEGLFRNLSVKPECAAYELLERLNIEDGKTIEHDLPNLSFLRIMEMNIEGDGYVVPPGYFGDRCVIVTSPKRNHRRRFTIAHEIGHIVLWEGGIQLQHREQERWCDQFAASLLMPRESIERFSTQIRSPISWLNLHREFKVSFEVASRRLWECRGIALVRINDRFGPIPNPANIMDEKFRNLIRQLEGVAGEPRETIGQLLTDDQVWTYHRSGCADFVAVSQL